MQPLPFQYSYKTLSNGLQFLSVKVPSRHRIILAAYVKVGSRFESKSTNGLSHVLEHMLFRGTKQFQTAYQLNRAIEELGATLYAETRRDLSLYQMDLPPENLKQGLDIFSQIFIHPTFSDIEIERNILLEEVREDFDEKGQDTHLSDLMYAHLFPKNSLGQKIGGPIKNIQRFDKQDLVRHLNHYYGAQNIIFCMLADAQADPIDDWVESTMGNIPPGTPAAYKTPLFPPSPRYIHRTGDGGTQTTLNLSFRTMGESQSAFPALLLMNRILDDGLSTRLYQRIVHDAGLAYHVHASLDTFEDVGVFEIEAVASHNNIPALLQELLAICSQLKHQPVSMDELQHAKRRYRWDLLSACDDPYSLLEWFGAAQLYHPPLTLEQKIERIQAVSIEDIQAIAKKTFCAGNLALGSLGPIGSKIKAQVKRMFTNYQETES